MKCPFCGAEDTAVADTRLNDEGDVVRRRRKCNACDKRFTTYERAEIQLPQVVKKNGLRTEFKREKLRASLELALRKRPVSIEAVDAAVADIEERLLSAGEREVTTQQLGELVMREGQAMAWQQLPLQVRPVLEGALPALQWLSAERGLAFDARVYATEDAAHGA